MSEGESGFRHDQQGAVLDFTDEETALRILERGTPEELEQFRAFHNLTPEQLSVSRYYVELRKTTHEKMQEELTQRVKINPLATREELSMGAYQEQIEPQVRDAVLRLRRKGYTTTTSGFSGFNSQNVRFGKAHLGGFQLSDALIAELAKQRITVRMAPDAFSFDCEVPLALDEIKTIWEKIESALPDLGYPAEPSGTGAAESFRARHTNFGVVKR